MTGTKPRRSLLATVAVAVAWATVLATAAWCLTRTGVPLGQVVGYLAAWLFGCTFPGVMVWRMLAGHTTAVRELGFGAVLGIVLQLLVWAVGTSVSAPRALLLAWPIVVALLCLALPRLRRHWLPDRTAEQRTPVGWSVAMAAVTTLSILSFYAASMVRRPALPAPIVISRDAWYNSAISAELSRTLRPQDPFVVGEPLRYHWFADAHITATAQLSGMPIVTAMLNPWQVVILIVLLLAVAAAAQQLMSAAPMTRPGGPELSDARRWWVGPVAAVFIVVTPGIWLFGRPTVSRVGNGFIPTSPSGILSLVLALALTGPVLDLLRGSGRRGTWVVLTLLLTVCAGTKPSLLPVVAFASLVVGVIDLVVDRRINRPMLFVVGASALLALGAAPLLTGSTGGSHLQLLGLMTLDTSYEALLRGEPVVPGAGGWLVPALADGVPGAVPVIAMLLVVWVLAETPRLLSLAGLLTRPLRSDPGVRWACAAGAGGYGAMWVLAHPGYSQHSFWTLANSLMTVVTVTNAVRLLPATRRARTLLVPAALMAVVGIGAGLLATAFGPVDVRGSVASVVAGRLGPYAVLVAGLLVSLVLALRLRVRLRRIALPVLTAVTVYCLAVAVVVPFQQAWERQPYVLRPEAQLQRDIYYVSAEQQRAALWLAASSASDDVFATNISCFAMGTDVPGCEISSMWLAGISGRRMVLGDWSYTSANQTSYDGSRLLNEMETPWPERLALSREAVRSPSEAVLGRLREDYGASWLLADDRASSISPRLSELAELRYQSQHIQIYRLRPSY